MVCFITWKMRGSSHQYPIARKMQQIYPLGRTWETDTHTSPKVWVVLINQILILWLASSQGKCIGHLTGRTRDIGIHTFSRVWVLLFHQIPFHGTLHPMKNAWGSPSIFHSMPGEPGTTVPILFPKYTWFSSIRFPSCGMLYCLGNAKFCQSIFRSM